MNIQFNAKQYTSAAEIFAEANARRNRFERAGNHPRQKDPEAPIAVFPIAFMAQQMPLWEFGDLEFDAHVLEWRWRQTNPASAYIKDRCAEIGMSYRHVIGPGRRDRVVEVRHLLMWEIYENFDLSLPQIGRLFGGRDHTSILYAVRKIEAQLESK